MNLLPDSFHFLRPAALLLLLALPLAWYLRRRDGGEGAGWHGVVDPALLPHLLARPRARSGRSASVLAAFAWLLAVLALAGPAWEREMLPLARNEAAQVLVLELAPSVLAEDLKPNRLARARFKIEDILARSADRQTALVAYAGDAFVVAPLTDDVATVRNLLGALDPSVMPVAGNAAGRGIDMAAGLIASAGHGGGDILLLADSAHADAIAAARRARAAGNRVSVLGLGTEAGAPVPLAQGGFATDAHGATVLARLDGSALQAVAAAGGGRYAPLSGDAGDLDRLLGGRGAAAAAMAGDGALARAEAWRDRGPWLLLLLLPLALVGFRRGWLLVLVAATLAPAGPAQAFEWADLWQRPDQQAAAALAQGEATRAASLATAPAWRGSAAYRAGEHAEAAAAFAEARGPDAAYNRGNALARLGRYEEALAAYDEALAESPGLEDAIENRRVVEEALRSRQQDGRGNGDGQRQQGGNDRQQAGSAGEGERGGPQDQGQAQPEAAQPGTGAEDGSQDSPGQASPGAEQGTPQDAGRGSAGKASAEPVGGQAPPAGAAGEAQAREALARSIDEAMAGKEQAAEDEATPASPTPATQDEATREEQQALEHLLRRVPDDPGGLLRRKFQLEYQRRQQRGESP